MANKRLIKLFESETGNKWLNKYHNWLEEKLVFYLEQKEERTSIINIERLVDNIEIKEPVTGFNEEEVKARVKAALTNESNKMNIVLRDVCDHKPIDFIKFETQKPEISQHIRVQFNKHRHGNIHSTGERDGVYVGMNTVIDMPMVDLFGSESNESDEYFLDFVAWKPLPIKK
jgi:hypothetical protein